MRTFTNPIGITIRYKYSLKTRLYDGAQGVMYYPIAEGGRADLASFGFMDKEMRIRAWCVAALHQLFVQLQQMVNQLKLEGGNINFAPLARSCALERLQQMWQTAKLFEGIAITGDLKWHKNLYCSHDYLIY